MNIWITIPTGQRAQKALETCWKWKEAGVKVAAYIWDKETLRALMDVVDVMWYGRRKSYPVLQNMMAKELFLGREDVDAIVCGSDDVWPKYGLELIEEKINLMPDCVLWVRDGLFDQMITHPIIPRKWFIQNGCWIFDERFIHNFCDTDLLNRLILKDQVKKCFSVSFDHRHWLKTNEVKDEIYKIGMISFAEDKEKFDFKWEKHPNIRTDLVAEI